MSGLIKNLKKLILKMKAILMVMVIGKKDLIDNIGVQSHLFHHNNYFLNRIYLFAR